MKYEKLGSDKGNRKFLYGFITCAVLLILFNIIFSYAKYKVVDSVKLASGTVNYTSSDLNIIAMYMNDETGKETEIKEIPKTGYTIDDEKSYCIEPGFEEKIKNILNYVNGKLTVEMSKKGTKCYLYFEKISKKMLNKLGLSFTEEELVQGFQGASCDNNCTLNQKGIYKNIDDDGDTYYFRGAVENNYIKLGDMYWRIIRINGDGTIRMIYNGISPHQNGENTDNSIAVLNKRWNIQEKEFHDNNMYVGLTWTENSVRGYEIKSNVYTELMNWYENNLKIYTQYLDTEAGFCNDRQPSSDSQSINDQGGTGTIQTNYGAYIRIKGQGTTSGTSYQKPTFKCSNETNKYSEDLYTVTSAKRGNKQLQYPIGLITADEVVFAGGYEGENNTGYYLYNGQNYWTMSPYYALNTRVYAVNNSGRLADSYVSNTYVGIRPVINLKYDVIFESQGNGTVSNPFIVKLT